MRAAKPGSWSQGEGDDSSRVRYEWKWYDKRGPPGAWNKQSAVEGQMSAHFSAEDSEVWECIDCEDMRTPANFQAGVEGEAAADLGYESPEEEFRRYTKSLSGKDQSGINLILEAGKYCSRLPEVYVILFGVGEASTEGIYSLRTECPQTGLHKETIISFESNEDAFRFAALLEATMTHVPSVHTIRPIDLIKFCEDSGYSCRLEQEGSMMMPPEFNVGITDWERSMRLREGNFRVLEQEPGIDRESVTASPVEEVVAQERRDVPRHSFDEARGPIEVSDNIATELDEVRAMLERLLPDD